MKTWPAGLVSFAMILLPQLGVARESSFGRNSSEHGRFRFDRGFLARVAGQVQSAACPGDSFLPAVSIDRSPRVSRIRQAIPKRDYDHALQAAEELIASERTNYEGWFWKGCIQTRRQEFYAAIRSLRSAERLNPWGNTVAKLLAHCYDVLDQRQLFVRKMQEAAALDPRDFAPYYHLGRNAAGSFRYEEARTYFEAALQRNPADYFSYYELGYCLESLGLLEKARYNYELSLRTAEGCGARFSAPFAGLSRAALAANDLAQALAHARRAVELEPKAAAHRMLLGQVLMKTGPLGEAADQLKSAIGLDPTASSLYYLLYQCYLKTGQKSLAEATLLELKRVLSYYGEGAP